MMTHPHGSHSRSSSRSRVAALGRRSRRRRPRADGATVAPEGRRVAAGPGADAAHRLRPGRRPQQDRRPAPDDLLRADAGQHARAVRRRGAGERDQDREHRGGAGHRGAAGRTRSPARGSTSRRRRSATRAACRAARCCRRRCAAPTAPIVALAQGPLSIGGFGGGSGGNRVQVNHLTVGRVPAARWCRPSARAALPASATILRSALHEPDFISADRVAEAINAELGAERGARRSTPARVAVQVPANYRSALPDLMARLEPLPVDDRRGGARRDQRAHRHRGRRRRRAPRPRGRRARQPVGADRDASIEVSQPNAVLARARRRSCRRRAGRRRRGRRASWSTLEEGTTLDAVVRALNALGATPRDIIAIMQALKAAGALRAEMVII